jgi:hypothetical protein
MKTIILMDVNTLPSEYKSGDLKSGVKRYEEDFDVKVIPYDTSKQNVEGGGSSIPIVVSV